MTKKQLIEKLKEDMEISQSIKDKHLYIISLEFKGFGGKE